MEKMLMYIVDKRKPNLSVALIFLGLLGCLGFPRDQIDLGTGIILFFIVALAGIYIALVFYALYYEHAIFVLFISMLATGGGVLLRLISGNPVMFLDVALMVAIIPLYITAVYRSLAMVAHHFES